MKEIAVSPTRCWGKAGVFSFFFPCSDSCEAGEPTEQTLTNTSKLVSDWKRKFSPLRSWATPENFSLPSCPLCLVTDKRQDFDLVPWVLRSSSCLNSFLVTSLQSLPRAAGAGGQHPSSGSPSLRMFCPLSPSQSLREFQF